MMSRTGIAIFLLFTFIGCDNGASAIVLPSKPLTDQEKLAIARGDAEICNCGTDIELRLLNVDD